MTARAGVRPGVNVIATMVVTAIATRRAGRVWIRVFPDVPVTSKPTEVRMGKGKGAPEYWAAKIKPGRIMFEIDGVSVETAREALTLAAAKLPIKTRFIQRIAE